MSNILVIGGTGFIGSKLVVKLTNFGHNVWCHSSRNGNIIDDDSLVQYAEKSITHVFHLAAKTFVPDSWESPREFFKVNTLGVIQALDFCRLNNCSFTYVSSYVYGSPNELPISESHEVKSNNPYGASKEMAEIACKNYANLFNVKTTIVRPFNIYGVGQNENFLIPFIIDQALKEDKIVLKDLSPKRDYLFAEDLIDGLVKSMNSELSYAIFNFGSGKSYSVREVVDTIQEILGTSKEVVDLGQTRPNEIMDTVADVSRAKEQINWEPSHSLKEGLTKIVNSIKK